MRPLRVHPAVIFTLIFFSVFLLHAPLLQLPYFWDEAGYYVAAARDILLSGSPIPHTTVSNAHPPLALAWIALWWKCFGFAPLVTRSAMLVIAAFSLTGVFRIAQRVANTQVATASTVCTATYSVFFMQSSMAHVDLAAAGLTFWGLLAYLENRPRAIATWFSFAALTKETAIIAPVAIAGFEALRWLFPCEYFEQRNDLPYRESPLIENQSLPPASPKAILALLFPVLPLAVWYCYHYVKTGFVFGNPEFFRYNVSSTLNPLRFVLALGLRLWQIFIYQNVGVLTLAMLLALLLPPVRRGGSPRPRIALCVQIVFLVVLAAYVVIMALIGGAVLARYMLPVIPLVIIVAVSTLWRRIRYWPAIVAAVVALFVFAWFVNPQYGFSMEDNLAYADYIHLHEDGEQFLEARFPMARALTAWPASDELTRPWLGYVTRPVQVVRIENFSIEQVLSAADFRSNFDVAFVFSTKYQPAHGLLDGYRTWESLKSRFFGFYRDLPPSAIARLLGGRIVFNQEIKGQWIAVIVLENVENAQIPQEGVPPQRATRENATPKSVITAASTGTNAF